ncbi:MAG: tetratricopeptide repeat protein [Labilithrix sp.]|nr:tetratricopeptide repeat protein [Labilithrix sp.]MCW5810404.1 tetratricopeptide repeat protein [Labilithrix sp.]
MSARSVALALILPAMLVAPLAAFGDDAPPPKKKLPPAATDVKYDPEEIVAISQFMETAVKGNELFVAKDYTAAIDTFKKAIQLAPKNALGPYLLAEAYLANGNMPEAEAAIASAVELAPTEPKKVETKARILFLRADIYEREKKWAEAKTAWQAYVDVASKVTGDAGVYPQTGTTRIAAIQKVIDLEAKYAAVRERIAADKADAGKSAAKPAPTKK